MPMPTEIAATDVSRTTIRTTPTGFCWEFHAKDPDSEKPLLVQIYFDLTWASYLARDLWRLVGLRKAENDAIANALAKDSSDA